MFLNNDKNNIFENLLIFSQINYLFRKFKSFTFNRQCDKIINVPELYNNKDKRSFDV